MSQLEYKVPGMTCGHCVQAVSGEVGALDGVDAVQVDLATKSVVVIGDNLDDSAIRSAIDEAGYEADPDPESPAP